MTEQFGKRTTTERTDLNRQNGAIYNEHKSWVVKNNYPEGYQVLCANCNMQKAKFEQVETRTFNEGG